MMVHMFVTYRVMSRVFTGMGPACRLPFEPPPFLQKARTCWGRLAVVVVVGVPLLLLPRLARLLVPQSWLSLAGCLGVTCTVGFLSDGRLPFHSAAAGHAPRPGERRCARGLCGESSWLLHGLALPACLLLTGAMASSRLQGWLQRASSTRLPRSIPFTPSHPLPQLFIFILCQSSLRLIIQKALNLGMGREFQVGSGRARARLTAAGRQGRREGGREGAHGRV